MDEPRPARAIAVFGSSEPVEGDAAYGRARRVGGLLASVGYRVVTGGYGGVMEAASRGAAEAGGRAIGVTCAIFPDRAPNPYLHEVVETPDLYERTRELVRRSDGFVVLPGKSGTLAELAFLWALHRAGTLGRRPVVLLGEPWRPLLRHLGRAGILEGPQFDVTRVVDSPEETIDTLSLHLERGSNG
jgi:uncharacterized protein (TIGR00730 family)